MRALFAVLILATGAPVLAEQDRLQPDFTFRRVKPPSPGHKGPRITVQIGAPAIDPKPANSADRYEWFWDTVPTGAGHPPEQRTAKALAALAVPGRGVPTPRLDDLKRIADAYGTALLTHSIGTKVSPALALAMIAVESAGDPSAVSAKGAVGLMQLMPATAAQYEVTDPLNPTDNIRAGMAHIDALLSRYDQDVALALAAYNAGPGAITTHGGIPPFAETRAYVPKVLATWRVARGLCKTPPTLTSDGCVFIR